MICFYFNIKFMNIEFSNDIKAELEFAKEIDKNQVWAAELLVKSIEILEEIDGIKNKLEYVFTNESLLYNLEEAQIYLLFSFYNYLVKEDIQKELDTYESNQENELKILLTSTKKEIVEKDNKQILELIDSLDRQRIYDFYWHRFTKPNFESNHFKNNTKNISLDILKFVLKQYYLDEWKKYYIDYLWNNKIIHKSEIILFLEEIDLKTFKEYEDIIMTTTYTKTKFYYKVVRMFIKYRKRDSYKEALSKWMDVSFDWYFKFCKELKHK